MKSLSFTFVVISLFTFFSFFVSSAFAQQYRTDAKATTSVGNPPVASIGNVNPTRDDCAGKLPSDLGFTSYAHYMSLTQNGLNFGDPNCDFTKTDLANTINQFETNPDRQKCFFTIIVMWESGYNANAYLGASTSNRGAYGLYQMNPADPRISDPASQNSYDVGNVYWKLQTKYAILHNQSRGNSFDYWDPRTLAHDPGRVLCHP